jgi:transposase-like protein
LTKKKSDYERIEALNLSANGYTFREIERALNVSHGFVMRLAWEGGLVQTYEGFQVTKEHES